MKETRLTFKTILSTGCLFLILGILTVNFQNCSGLSSADFGSDNSVVSQGESGIIPIGGPPTIGGTETTVELESLTVVFSSGENFVGQNLIASGSFLDTLIDKIGYENYSTGKAIAVARNGLGYAALTESSNSEAERMAVESCNLLSGTACAIIVSGNLFMVNSRDAFTSEDYIIGDYSGRVFNRSEIPMSATRVRDSAVVSNFINAPGYTALAISITGGVYSVYSTTDSLTKSEVRRMAVQRCELEAAITPCILYAEDDTVVFNPAVWVKSNSISFSNNNVSALPPPASGDGALDIIQKLLTEVGRDKYAIYITPSGYGYFGRDATDVEAAKAEALAACNAGAHGTRCISYASSTGVSLSPDSLNAKMSYADFFCKTVRYNCSAHLDMGCTRGAQYWVQNLSTLEAELTSCGN